MRFSLWPSWLLGCFIFAACSYIEPENETKRIPSSVIARVLIQPLNDADTASIHFLQQGIQDSLGAEVQILPLRNMPAHAWYAARKRYWADTVLQWLQPLSAKRSEKILAVTGKDISTSTIKQYNWGIMGLAFQPGAVCIVSDYRLHSASVGAVQRRHKLLKVALHELGHTTGLPHCAVATCLMADAEGKDKTAQLTGFCNSCSTHIFKH